MPKERLTEDEKRRRGLIRTPAAHLKTHFNYYYLFKVAKTPPKSPNKQSPSRRSPTISRGGITK